LLRLAGTGGCAGSDNLVGCLDGVGFSNKTDNVDGRCSDIFAGKTKY